MKIAAVQMDFLLGEPENNLDNMIARLEVAAQAGAALTVFPECALTGYCFESHEEAFQYGQTIPGASTEKMTEACKRLGCHVVYGLLEVDGERLFNACALVGPDGLVGSYRKIHLPRLGVDCFTTPGDRPFEVWPVGEAKVGMHICYDGAFPEAPRAMALLGADLIVLPTNWPPGTECTASCIANARALENNVYYLAVNRIGTERGFRFIGNSRICDTDGSVLASALHEDEAILYAEIDVTRARQKRLVRVPGKHEIHRFADRRPEMYGPLVDSNLVPPREI
ncbi:MAG: carbon-nitrogen hydrolase family protein [Candidatus Omnitrophica bacterium]|nr:carbon-nitrogen hydrolase family protein [Candidatus Omnitrophota bacterium]